MIAIIDYKSGNVASVANALIRLGQEFCITSDPIKISQADKVIFPGVGRAMPAMKELRKNGLDQAIREIKVPFLGICLGMQLLMTFSEEDNTQCLGIIKGQVKKFSGNSGNLKVPQIGWNTVSITKSDPLFRGIPNDSYFYFVDSYYVELNGRLTLGMTTYKETFTSVIKQKNFYGVQFHPEKSGLIGQILLKNFCSLNLNPQEQFEAIPAVDIIDGKCVRLTKGDFEIKKMYSDNLEKVVTKFADQGASLIHVVDLDGAKAGKTLQQEKIISLAQKVPISFQVGGGIRTYNEARQYLENGMKRVVLGTSAVLNPNMVKKLIDTFGSDRIMVAVDVMDGYVAIKGWQEISNKSVSDFLADLKELGVKIILLTDTTKDGTLSGPNFDLIQKVVQQSFQVIVAGGVASYQDVLKTKKIGALGVVIGKALYENKVDLETCLQEINNDDLTTKLYGNKKLSSGLTKRVIACMDINDGRVKKGTNYLQLRDAGDPVELGKLYSDFGADELIFLDIGATVEKRSTLLDLVEKVAQNINIPFTVGGGIKSLDNIREILKRGADKISLGSAAVQDPEFVRSAAQEFGSQCIVISIDPKWSGTFWEVYINGGTKATGIDAVEFAKKMETLGAGELLVNSLDYDGTKQGYDINLLKKISQVVTIPVIASSGAGKKQDFLDAYTKAGADAALAAGLFHSQEIKIPELKEYLMQNNIAIRL
jgi:phosphoribosylformimino-5-aminoimidazole carboxamide ribotide isomerase/imidazole glycerol phosphate synthase glutamine amidotransferase subunit